MTTTFNQVHLPEHTIDSVRTIASLPLLHPQVFQQGILKEHGMTGCLLFGPPGTGKALIVRALAKGLSNDDDFSLRCHGHGKLHFLVAMGRVLIRCKYAGEGEELVRAVFSLARRLAPCLVFLDEIDALFGVRMSARESGGAFTHRGVITEFMQEMDGLKSSQEDRVIVIGATNRPFDLDDAVLRRLPRRLLVDLPGEKGREGEIPFIFFCGILTENNIPCMLFSPLDLSAILEILLRDEQLAEDADVKSLARKAEGFSGSDLKREHR
jgi:ATP-dependent 26S proteasome regulatory subunit